MVSEPRFLNCGFSIPLRVRIMAYFIRPSLHNSMVQCLHYATNNCATCFDPIVPVPVPNLGSMVYFIRPSLHNNMVQCLYYATNNCVTCFDPIVPVPVPNLGSIVYFIRPSLHNSVVQCLYYATNNCATRFDPIVPVPVPNLGSRYILSDRHYTTIWCNVYIMQLTTVLHVSTL